MLPERLLRHEIRGDAIVAHYLGPRDEAWLTSLLALAREHAGLPRRDFEARVRDGLASFAPRDAVKLAAHVLLGMGVDALRSPVRPRVARREVYTERGRSRAGRDEVLATVAERLAITPSALDRSLLADIPSERRVGGLPGELSPVALVELVNLVLAQGVVARACRVTIDLEGHVRRVVQQATWQGLICTVRGADPAHCRIEVSGPLAVLRSTRLYGRALASVVPILPWCRRFRLEAACRVNGRESIFRLDECDPIGRGVEPRRHDSAIEEAFEADLRRLAPDWDVLREPQALPVAGTLVFPDFAIGPRASPSSRVLVEIVAWWTRDYVESKLARLRAARCERLITCVEERLVRGTEATALAGLDVIAFRRRVDVARVLERAKGLLARGDIASATEGASITLDAS